MVILMVILKMDWQKQVPLSRPWNWLSSRKLPGIVFPFHCTLMIYITSRHCFPFPTNLEIHLIFSHFPTKGQQIVAATETPP